jgi:hypothetical protein
MVANVTNAFKATEQEVIDAVLIKVEGKKEGEE